MSGELTPGICDEPRIYEFPESLEGEILQLHINLTEEGVIMDVFDRENCVATSSEMAEEIVERMLERQVEINQSIAFSHLTEEQKTEIFGEAIEARVNSCREDDAMEGGYLWGMVRDSVASDDIQIQLASISSDPECVKEILGFDPWEGK